MSTPKPTIWTSEAARLSIRHQAATIRQIDEARAAARDSGAAKPATNAIPASPKNDQGISL